jgi:hypothetical protein
MASFEGRIDLEHGGEIRQVEQFANMRLRARKLHELALIRGRHVHEHQFSQAGAVQALYTPKIENHFSGMLQSFPGHPGESNCLIADTRRGLRNE